MKNIQSEPRKGRRSASAGAVSLLEFYTIEEAKSRLGWSDSAFRAAKRRGLQLLASGKRRYVTGREILRFLEAEGAQSGNDRGNNRPCRIRVTPRGGVHRTLPSTIL